MLTFSSQTLSLGNWITRKQEEATPPPKMFLSKGRVFLLRADPASEGLSEITSFNRSYITWSSQVGSVVIAMSLTLFKGLHKKFA